VTNADFTQHAFRQILEVNDPSTERLNSSFIS
jgi:hypothetical protein